MEKYYARCSAEPAKGHRCERTDTRLFCIEHIEQIPWIVGCVYGEMMVMSVCPEHTPDPLPEGWMLIDPEDFEAADLVGGVHGE